MFPKVIKLVRNSWESANIQNGFWVSILRVWCHPRTRVDWSVCLMSAHTSVAHISRTHAIFNIKYAKHRLGLVAVGGSGRGVCAVLYAYTHTRRLCIDITYILIIIASVELLYSIMCGPTNFDTHVGIIKYFRVQLYMSNYFIVLRSIFYRSNIPCRCHVRDYRSKHVWCFRPIISLLFANVCFNCTFLFIHYLSHSANAIGR